MAHVPLHQLADVAHAERPVRHPHRQPVDRGFHHEAVGDQLELDRVVLEPQFVRERFDPRRVLRKRGHRWASLAWAAKNWRIACQMSFTSETTWHPPRAPLPVSSVTMLRMSVCAKRAVPGRVST